MTPNIASREHKANPYPFYARLRAESPVFRVTLPDKRAAWLVTRYDDAVAVLKDERFVKDVLNAGTNARKPWMPEFARPLSRNMLDVDEPDHGRLRGLVNRAFTPRLVEGMRERIQSLADELLSQAASIRHFDLIRDFAHPIPTTVIAEMLGVPVKDRHRFSRWSRAIVSAHTSLRMMWAVPNIWLFLRYIRRLVRERRSDPRDDLVSALVQAEESGGRLNEDELASMIFLLLVAGHETTVNLIGNGVLALIDHPDQLDRLRSDPSLIKSAIEEMLRYDSPLETATERFARENVELGGATIPKGAIVYAVIASANRDERQFANADTFDISREPNRHLSFGLGAHYCLGAPLARLEGQIAVESLLKRAPIIQLSTPRDSLRWRPALVVRGLESLPLRLALRANRG